MNVLITGGTGFVGRALSSRLFKLDKYDIRAVVRKKIDVQEPSSLLVAVECITKVSDWNPILCDRNVVIHTAARVHVMNDTSRDPLDEFRRVNVEGTLNLARQAAAAGVKRFVFVSSIKVNGESTALGRPFKAEDPTSASDPYGISKHEAEEGLRILARETGMEVVIIRPPLVYGPGVKANFASMMRVLAKGRPLPFGAIEHNRRSLVALDNLVDLLVTCIDHPAAANETFLVSDGEDLSTTDLLHRMGLALNKPARLLPISPGILQFTAKLLGKGDVAQRLLGSLQVDISKTRELLDWTPPITVDEGLRRAAQGFSK